jgi:hypothetical protein
MERDKNHMVEYWKCQRQNCVCPFHEGTLGVEVYFHSYLTSALDRVHGYLHAVVSLPLVKEPPVCITLAAWT